MTSDLHGLLLVFATYVVVAGSPGPSNMRIMGAAMSQGRPAALALAAGVLTGSVFWGLMAATGLAAILARYADLMSLLRIVCAVYLLYLGYRAGRIAFTPGGGDAAQAPAGGGASYGALYRRGLLLHLTNVKSVLGWIALMTVGLGPDASWRTVAVILAGCAVLGTCIFTTYAIVFSSGPMVRGYRRARRWIEGVLAGFFTLAGLQLLASRS